MYFQKFKAKISEPNQLNYKITHYVVTSTFLKNVYKGKCNNSESKKKKKMMS